MPKKFIALIMAVVMSSQMMVPIISYGEDLGDLTTNIEDSTVSGSGIVIEEPTEITAEQTVIASSGNSSETEEVISADFSEEGNCGDNLTYSSLVQREK